MPSKKKKSVPSLQDLCSQEVGENLDVIADCWSSRRVEEGEEFRENEPLLLNPFDLLRNSKIYLSYINVLLKFFPCFSASSILSKILDIAIKKEPRKMDHLRLLITRHSVSLKLNLSFYDPKDTDTAIQLLSTAALRHLVAI